MSVGSLVRRICAFFVSTHVRRLLSATEFIKSFCDCFSFAVRFCRTCLLTAPIIFVWWVWSFAEKVKGDSLPYCQIFGRFQISVDKQKTCEEEIGYDQFGFWSGIRTRKALQPSSIKPKKTFFSVSWNLRRPSSVLSTQTPYTTST